MTYQPPFNGKRISVKADSNSSIETGVVTLSSGTNITLGQAGNTITIASTAAAADGDIEVVGVIKMYAGSAAPTGWHLCDGSAVNRSTYSDLFAVIGTTYGSGDGSSTFNLPDLRARVPVGAGTGTKTLTFASRSNSIITVTGADSTADNEIQTGTAVAYASTGTNITGLTSGTYYIIRQTSTSFSLATSRANAVAGTAVTLTGDGTGTRTFTITVGDKTRGTTGGEETHTQLAAEMPSHTHIQDAHTHIQDAHTHTQNSHTHNAVSGNPSALYVTNTTGTSANISTGGGGYAQNAPQAATATNQNTTATNQNTTATNQNAGGSGNHNNLQPYVVVNYIIKMVSQAVGSDTTTPEYLRAEQRTDQDTSPSEVSANDHIKFSYVDAYSSGSISLDTSTTYTTSAGASIGRFTLASGKTYRVSGVVPWVSYSGSGKLAFRWYNLTSSSYFGTAGYNTSSTYSSNEGSTSVAEGVITTAAPTMIELRIVSSSNVTAIGDSTSTNQTSNAFIEVIEGVGVGGDNGTTQSLFGVATKTGNYTLITSDTMILADATSGTFTVTLPAANTVQGYRFYVKKIDSSSNAVSIARSGSDTIDGATSASITGQYTVIGLVSNGSGWYII